MELVTEKPLERYFEKCGASTVKKLAIASPFITGPGVQYISKFIKRRKVQVEVLTNLSEFNLLRSLNNPIQPLKTLSEQLGDRLTIKSSLQLHAKLFMADQRLALHGSSNLTLGGGARNHELNVLINSRSAQGRDHLTELSKWFRGVWESSGSVEHEDLERLEERWLENTKRVQGAFREFSPEPRLAGQQWEKVKEITGGGSLDKQRVLDILMRTDEDPKGKHTKSDPPQNAERKLLYLVEQGLVMVEGGQVHPLKKVSKPEEMIEVLLDSIPSFEVVQHFLRCKSDVAYADISAGVQGVCREEIETVVLWLEDLGYIDRKRVGGQVHRFSWLSK